jgi:hypothetical protein
MDSNYRSPARGRRALTRSKAVSTYCLERDRRFADSPLEGDGFEPSVPALYRARTAPFGTLGRYAAHRVDDAGEFHEHAVAGRLDAPREGHHGEDCEELEDGHWKIFDLDGNAL